jgi:hypothetical protein
VPVGILLLQTPKVSSDPAEIAIAAQRRQQSLWIFNQVEASVGFSIGRPAGTMSGTFRKQLPKVTAVLNLDHASRFASGRNSHGSIAGRRSARSAGIVRSLCKDVAGGIWRRAGLGAARDR